MHLGNDLHRGRERQRLGRGRLVGRDELERPGHTQRASSQPGGSWLAGVSCATATACVAIGGLSSYHIGGALVELWGGLSWTLNSPELPDVFDISQLNGVSCSSPTTCVVVGQSASQQVATTWDGAAWTIEHPPTPSGASITSLNGVSCTSTTACTAVGSYKRSPYTTMTTQLIEHEP